MVVGGGYTGLLDGAARDRRNPLPAWCCSRRSPWGGRHRVATAASARPSSRTAARTACAAGPRRWTPSTGSASRTSTRSRPARASTGWTSTSSATARSPSRWSRTRSSGSPTRRRSPDGGRDDAFSSSTATPCGPRSPPPRISPGGGTTHDGARAPGEARRRARPDGHRARRRGLRALGGAGLETPTRRVRSSRTGGQGAAATSWCWRPTRSRRCCGQPADDRAGLRLRADDRAAHADAAGRDRLAQPPGRRRPRQPVPLLPAHRRQPDPVRRVRRDLPLRTAHPGRARGPAESTSGSRATSSTTFPQLEGVGFTHRWGGAIDTSTRFCAFYGTAGDGRVAYAAGFTGLGVGATRFAADVMLDLLDGRRDRAHATADGARAAVAVPARAGGRPWASRLTRGRSTAPTTTRAGATCC